MTGLDDETVAALQQGRTYDRADLPPDPDHPGFVIVPPDPRPLEERWPNLDAFEAENERGISFEDWAQLEIEREE